MLCRPLSLFLCFLFVLLCNRLAEKYTNDCESYNENERRETNCPFARREEGMYLTRGAEEWLEAYHEYQLYISLELSTHQQDCPSGVICEDYRCCQ